MTATRRRRLLLLAYPRRWRDRYEDEVLAFLDDEYAGGAMPLSAAGNVVATGLVERSRTAVDVADRVDGPTRTSGLALVAWGWWLCVIGGIAFAKESEHFASTRESGPSGFLFSHMTAVLSAETVPWVAAVALSVMVVLATPAILVAAVAADHDGRRRVRHAAAVAVATAGAAALWIAGLVAWAHTLSSAQRNGANSTYTLVAVATALVVAASLAAATRVATESFAIVRPRGHRRALVVGVVAVAASLVVIAVAVAAWWVAVARDAPGFIGPTGVHASIPAQGWPSVLVAELCLVAGAVLAVIGARRALLEAPPRAELTAR